MGCSRKRKSVCKFRRGSVWLRASYLSPILVPPGPTCCYKTNSSSQPVRFVRSVNMPNFGKEFRWTGVQDLEGRPLPLQNRIQSTQGCFREHSKYIRRYHERLVLADSVINVFELSKCFGVFVNLKYHDCCFVVAAF